MAAKRKTAKDPLSIIADIEASTYRNSSKIFTLGGVDFSLWDVVKTALAGRLNVGLQGEAGMGKSQLISSIRSLSGNNDSYVLCRNDLDIKSLFRQLNFAGLKQAMDEGGTVAQKDLTQVTAAIHKPLVVVEELDRATEIVQNQLFNIFEGFIEIDGTDYPLGGSELQTFTGLDGEKWKQNVRYSVGVWSANQGNGEYTGTVSIDKAMKQRSHLILDVDNKNFLPRSQDLDNILLGSGGEVRLKSEDKPEDRTKLFMDAFAQLKQESYTPSPAELGEELLFFRYLVLGLDYIPCPAADNSKRSMKAVWPSKAEEEPIGSTDEEKILYRMVYPASIRSALTITTLARALRAYAKAKDPQATPSVLDSVMESFTLVGAYSGIIGNPQRVREEFVGNLYKASRRTSEIVRGSLAGKSDLIQAISYKNATGEPLTKAMLKECSKEFECFR